MSEELIKTQEEPKKSILTSNKGKLLIALVLVLGALSYFGFIAFKGATVYYLTVGELKANQSVTPDQIIRVSGKLVTDSYKRDEASSLASFLLTDGKEVMPATYKGAIPDLFFDEHSEIILEGTYGTDKEFTTQNIIVKCPSKYIAKPEEKPAS